ncbi:hypothetical protein PENARI_c010G05427 [Penicillium arizonense]|uniref:Cytochrome P450 n=1 Tax=Penicillium arizonense TaxID=1835702 RepID=A0A1F5LGE0_PENAI|nr:hypothetical protein PENARI_c010G05427 [Penicillium arizonense]OGE52283.1 hypothetical protein PENARI_c010G05427 [Penicillium arizonense]
MSMVCYHLSKKVGTGDALELQSLFACFAADTLSTYIFGSAQSFGSLKSPDITDDWKRKINSVFEMLVLVRHFPWLLPLARTLPSVASRIYPTSSWAFQAEMQIRQSVKAVYDNPDGCLFNGSRKSMLSTILASDKAPKEEKDFERLAQEMTFIMVAGTDAPSQVMAITMFHILRSPDIHQKLKAELNDAFPVPVSNADWNKLEHLPYLSAVIKEGLRISAVVTTRLPRIAPEETLHYKEWSLLPGTAVSMSNHFILRDNGIFPRPMEFLPERWMTSPNEVHLLDKYLVPFAKGNSSCLGPYMAYSWLYSAVGTVIRKFDLELYETNEENVRIG